jgi:hypothetical protein
MARLTLVLALAICACSGEENPIPSAVVGVAPPIGVACSTLVQDGFQIQGTTLVVDGEAARCAAPGMFCPIAQDPESMAAAECTDDQLVTAFCPTSQTWKLLCRLPVDAGSAGAGGSGG